MTDTGFGRLLYTDCAPGTGRNGGGGFQVQAQSPQVDSASAALATSWLLYEVQNAWITEQRPAGDFPPGFAHVAAAGYGTGQSRYLGKEVMGGRQGNHLADCLVTGDPDLYGTIRPAQLYGAPFWRSGPWPTTDCPDFDGDLEPGGLLTLEELTSWVRASKKRGQVLADLLTILEDPDGPRVVIVSSDLGEAMRWLAAATVLLPQRRALGITFKVFSANPLRAQQRVVAAPADLNPQLSPGRVPGLFIVDAAACQADKAEVSERAAFLAGKLAGDAQADPFDLLDALELADELSGGSWPTGAAALAAAWALTRPDEPLENPEAVQAWLRGAEAGQVREHGPALVEMMLAAASPSADMLRWLDGAIAAGRLAFDPEAARTGLLTAELADALSGTAVPPQVLPRVRLSDKAERDAESELTSALLLGDPDRMDVGRFDRVLRLAFRHRIGLQPAPLRERLHRFAVNWIDDPRRAWDPAGRALADSILDEAYGALHELFTEPLTQQLAKTLVRFRGLFDDRDDLADPLYCHLQAAVIAGLKGQEDRLDRLQVSLAKIARLPEGSPQAAEAARAFQEALLAWKADDTDVALAILAQLPAHIHPRIGERANGFLAAARAKPDAGLLDMLASLHANGWRPHLDELSVLLDGELKVRGFLAAAARDDIVDRDGLTGAAELISDADPVVVQLRAGKVLDAFLTTRNPHLAGAVLARYQRTRGGRGKPKPVQTLIGLAGERMAAATPEESARITARLVLVLANQMVQRNQPERWDRVAELLRGYDSRLGARDSKRWRADVRAMLPPDSPGLREWTALFDVETIRPGGMFNLVRKTES